MSRLIDQEPKAFAKYNRNNQKISYKLAKNIVDTLGDNLTSEASLDPASKLAILNEMGTARNIDRINIKDSLYEASKEEDSFDLFSLF
jgi:hypothetical protein